MKFRVRWTLTSYMVAKVLRDAVPGSREIRLNEA